jgi:hypothetical protein
MSTSRQPNHERRASRRPPFGVHHEASASVAHPAAPLELMAIQSGRRQRFCGNPGRSVADAIVRVSLSRANAIVAKHSPGAGDRHDLGVAIDVGSQRVGTIALQECDRRAAGAVRASRTAELSFDGSERAIGLGRTLQCTALRSRRPPGACPMKPDVSGLPLRTEPAPSRRRARFAASSASVARCAIRTRCGVDSRLYPAEDASAAVDFCCPVKQERRGPQGWRLFAAVNLVPGDREFRRL